MLIADHLAGAGADQNSYADPAALRDARAQLLQALFEGSVRSEGVSYEVGPREYGPPSIEYDRWIPIDQGVWLHEKCEELDHIYRLDSVEVYWNRDEIGYFDSDGYWAECGERKIRIYCADLDREFLLQDPTAQVSVPADPPAGSQHRTGTAGRPSPKYLAQREMERRANQRILSLGIAAEMRELCLWLKQEHPDAPPVKPKSLENSLRDQYRALKRTMNLPG
jgi:hypothetical protein